MRLFFFINGLLILFFSVTWAYSVNYETRAVVKRTKVLESQIEAQEEYFKVLEAEWAYLNRPDRLESLVEIYFSELRLMPLRKENYKKLENIEFYRPTNKNLSMEVNVSNFHQKWGLLND
tara:strand:- start:150 stop:509 length:360 start_codon:yes stop_codon:yes gene_type:complete